MYWSPTSRKSILRVSRGKNTVKMSHTGSESGRWEGYVHHAVGIEEQQDAAKAD